jgi:hypothetical protein
MQLAVRFVARAVHSPQKVTHWAHLTANVCVQFPYTAAITGVAYLLGALGYFLGYSTGVPGKRVTHGGTLRFSAQAVLCGMCIRYCVQAFM